MIKWITIIEAKKAVKKIHKLHTRYSNLTDYYDIRVAEGVAYKFDRLKAEMAENMASLGIMEIHNEYQVTLDSYLKIRSLVEMLEDVSIIHQSLKCKEALLTMRYAEKLTVDGNMTTLKMREIKAEGK